MRTTELGLSLSVYLDIVEGAPISDATRSELRVSLAQQCPGRVLLFGDSVTARFFASLLEDRLVACVNSTTLSFGFAAAYDSLLVAVSPQHYSAVLETAKANCPDAVRVVLPFSNPYPGNVRVIVDTQPRSGTHYMLNTLMGLLQCNYATVFERETKFSNFTGRALRQGDIYFDMGGDPSHGHVVKCHFFQRAQDPDYAARAKRVKVLGYPFDSYYRWARDVFLEQPQGESYVLRHDTPEWKALRMLLYQNACWMLEDTPGLAIRYEDFWHDMDATALAVCGYLGIAPQPFPAFRKTCRTYFDDGYARVMDRVVFDTILEVFGPALAKYYPEKRPVYTGTGSCGSS